MIEQSNKIIVIDNHESAKKNLQDIEDKYKIFDMTHSGVVLAWNYFYPEETIPLLYKYVEDRDIWKKEIKLVLQYSQRNR